jgi:hypothetical protein
MGIRDRIRTTRWLRPALVVTATGVVLLIVAITFWALSTHGSTLNLLAAKAGVLGAALTAVGMTGSLALSGLSWLSGGAIPIGPSELLRSRVVEYEERVRTALLNGLNPANVVFAAGQMQISESAARSSSRTAAAAVEQVWDMLLRFRKGDSDDAVDGDLAGIGSYYREVWAQGYPRLLILGRPGSGKTVLAIELILQLLRGDSVLAPPWTAGERIPARFSVATWTVGTGLREWFIQRLMGDYALPSGIAEALVDRRLVLPVLDGLDEMDIGSAGGHDKDVGSKELGYQPRPRARAFLAELSHYAEGNQYTPLILTCRDHVYKQLQADGVELSGHQEITIKDLDADRIRRYLHARYPNPADVLRRRWDKLLDRLDEPDGAVAQRVLSTPWRLLLAISAVEDGQQPVQLLAAGVGEDPSAAADRINRSLVASYISSSTRVTVRRSRYGMRTRRYDAMKVTRWMRYLACDMQWQAEQVDKLAKPPLGMSAIDLVPHLLWPIGGLRIVRALHGACNLIVMSVAIGLATVTIGLIGPLKDTFFGHASTGTICGVIGSIIGGILLLAFAYNDGVKMWPKAAFSVRERLFSRRRFVRGLPYGLLIGLSVGVIFLASAQFLTPRPSVIAVLPFALLLAVATGPVVSLILGFAYGLTGEEWRPDAELAGPHDSLRHERLAGFVAGLAGGLAVGLVTAFGGAIPMASVRGTTWVTAIRGGAMFGLAVGLVVWLGIGAVWIRYVIGVLCASARRRLPLRVKSFMTWACDSGLLRVAGTAYQFRHRELQAWLVEGPDEQGRAAN